MKITNLNSKYDLSTAQLNYVRSIVCDDDTPCDNDGIFRLMDEIPIFLLQPDSMPKHEHEQGKCERPATEWLGFYMHDSPILGVNTPAIGLCPERIIECAGNEEELILLTAKVVVHEFGHAKMHCHRSAHYTPRDEFYDWMEEAMANFITLEYFSRSRHRHGRENRVVAHVSTLLDPFDYARNFISGQPDNYRLALDLYDHQIGYWWIWRNRKEEIQKKKAEKQDWLDYVKANVGKTNELKLSQLFEALHR